MSCWTNWSIGHASAFTATWKFGAGTSSVDGDAISCNPMNHMISHTASATYKRVLDYAELSRMYGYAVPDLGGLI